MEGYIHEPTHYYYFYVEEEEKSIIQFFFNHLSEAIQDAKKNYQPIDIYNSENILVHSLPIHEF